MYSGIIQDIYPQLHLKRNSRKFEQEKHPDADTHSNKVFSKSCFRSDTSLTPLTTSIISFPPNTPHQIMRNALPNHTVSMSPIAALSTS